MCNAYQKCGDAWRPWQLLLLMSSKLIPVKQIHIGPIKYKHGHMIYILYGYIFRISGGRILGGEKIKTYFHVVDSDFQKKRVMTLVEWKLMPKWFARRKRPVPTFAIKP